MPITLITSVTATPGLHGGATAAIDTTGADLIVIVTGGYIAAGGVAAASDSKGNIWVTQGSTALYPHAVEVFYCLAPTVGTGHTFTVTGSFLSPPIVVYAFAGAVSWEAFSSAVGTSPLASGGLTPSEAGALIVTGVCAQTLPATVMPLGFSLTSIAGGTGAIPAAAAWRVQSTAAFVNPTWSDSGSPGFNVQTHIFLPADGGVGSGHLPMFTAGGTHGPLSWIELVLKAEEE